MRIPSYRKHSSGQGRVTILGRDFLLGEYGSKASIGKYKRLIAEWMVAGDTFGIADPTQLTNVELVAAYLKHCKKYYGTEASSEFHRVKPALRALKALYGTDTAISFGPKQFKAVRQELMNQGERSRQYVNALCKKLKRMYAWATSESLIPPAILQSLSAVDPLKAGRTTQRESEDVKPVAEELVKATLPFLPPVVADMVRFQLLTGCRPGEVCAITPAMVKRSGDVWEIELHKHKNSWRRGEAKTIYVPPSAQAVLAPYLLRDHADHCFKPADSERRRRTRTVPLNHGNSPGKSNTERKTSRTIGESYTTGSYGKAILRACDKAHPVPKEIKKSPEKVKEWQSKYRWSANQLRHSFATKATELFGIETTSVLMSHSGVAVTAIYAEKDRSKAIAAARQLG
jgi:integrase